MLLAIHKVLGSAVTRLTENLLIVVISIIIFAFSGLTYADNGMSSEELGQAIDKDKEASSISINGTNNEVQNPDGLGRPASVEAGLQSLSKMLGSLLFVLVTILSLAWLAKRFTSLG